MDLKPILPIDTDIDQTNYYWFQNGFSSSELEEVEKLATKYSYTDATIVGNESINESIRKSKIKWIHPNEDSQWLYDKFADMVIEANKTWKFNLYSIIDSIQYTEYLAGGGHYDWHVDIGPKNISHRKVSITVQLSDPNEYDGGDLELWNGGNIKPVFRGRGATILFPSFIMHRVTPVTQGLRKSLVLWVGGEHYK